jgi:peptidoglycan/xylan/chitin deacetylase (PgdA/CDA1 family)
VVSRAGAAALTLVAGAVAVHVGPAVVAIGPLRRRYLPGLAGIGDPGHVALTFDDGPHPEGTRQVLRILGGHGIRATFFLVGAMLTRHPELGRELVSAGHEIAVHGYQHRLLATRGARAGAADLVRGAEVVADLTGAAPRWWRPPYGVPTAATLATARRLGLTPVLWTCWGRDWAASASGASVHRTVLRQLRGGGTVLLHDSDHAAAPGSWQATVAALPALLRTCADRGLRVGPLAEHGLAAAPPASATP